MGPTIFPTVDREHMSEAWERRLRQLIQNRLDEFLAEAAKRFPDAREGEFAELHIRVGHDKYGDPPDEEMGWEICFSERYDG